MRPQVAAALALLLGGAASAQDMAGFDQPPVRAQQFVSYVAESEAVQAGRPVQLELRFHVSDGFHLNSHTPASELQIATALQLQSAPGVRAGEAEYPPGHPYKVGDQTLNVYTGDFTVRLPVTASAGDHAVDGFLRYQACDKAACYPAKKLRVRVLFNAR